MNDTREQLKIGNFRRLRSRGWTVLLNPRFPRLIAEAAILRQIDPGSAPGRWQTVTSSDYTHVHRGELPADGRILMVFAKEFLYRNAGDLLKHLLRPGRARRSVTASLTLQNRGFDCPEVIALAQHHCGPLCLKSLVVTTAIDPAEPLYDWLQETGEARNQKTLRNRRRLIRRFGRTIGRLHAAGICHGDLRPRNVMVRLEEDCWRFFFLDNERTKIWPRLSARHRLKNLIQINMFPQGLSRTDRLRFWKAYLAENPSLEPEQRRWIRDIMHRTTERIESKYGPLPRPL